MSCLANNDSISPMFLSNISVSNPNSANCERTLPAFAFAASSSTLFSIPGAGQISMSRSIILIFSFLNSLNTPSCNFLDTNAITLTPSLDN